jgi:hypothetical protein
MSSAKAGIHSKERRLAERMRDMFKMRLKRKEGRILYDKNGKSMSKFMSFVRRKELSA